MWAEIEKCLKIMQDAKGVYWQRDETLWRRYLAEPPVDQCPTWLPVGR